MGRLIDADKCPCILCEDTRNAHCTYEHRSCAKFCNWLNNTAYDVEKVVAELEKESDFFSGKPMGTLQKAYYCKGIERAIEIVKKGGV